MLIRVFVCVCVFVRVCKCVCVRAMQLCIIVSFCLFIILYEVMKKNLTTKKARKYNFDVAHLNSN